MVTRTKKLSVQELMAVFIPGNISVVMTLYAIFAFWKPNSDHFLLPLIPSNSKSLFVTILLTFFEALLPIVSTMNTAFIIFTYLLFFQKCHDQSLLLVTEISSRKQRLFISFSKTKVVYKKIRELQLWIQLFNRGMRFNLYASKLYFTTMTIFYISFGIYILHINILAGLT
ncbi:unnamed protein product, partial [Allacma fusca]